MSDDFDHDAEANEYHIAVKQQLYRDIDALRARVRELEGKLEFAHKQLNAIRGVVSCGDDT